MQSKLWAGGLKCLVSAVVICVFCSGERGLAQTLMDPLSLTKYLDPLPNPLDNVVSPVGTMDGMDLYEVSITQFSQQLHSQLDPTTVWGYNGAYPGPTFDVQRNVPIKVNWINGLVDGTGTPLPHLLPVDTTVHGAGPQFPEARIVTHLHGGVVEPESDGFPEYWYSADPNAPANGMGGPAGNSALYTYHNQQPSSTLWYHDHGMGITRLNVYAGLAGFYLVRDAEEAALNLPSGNYEVPLVIQDRTFYDDGQLFYPAGPGDLTSPGVGDPLEGLDDPNAFPSAASVVPQFFGDTNLVNGKVWPMLEVEPRKYRFRILNGSNARFYDLQLDAGLAGTLPFHQIGSDGGLLEATTDRSQMLMAPAERNDVIVDFSNLSVGSEVILRNFGPDGPFESPTASYSPADPDTTGQVMKFKVVGSSGPDTSSLPSTLVEVPRMTEDEAVATRQLSLVDELDEFGRPKLLLDGQNWTDPTTELPLQGTTEIWEITNSTVGSHPIHLHLVQFQVLDRFARPPGGGEPVEIPLEPYELGWKDTFKVNRRETVRVIARFEDFDGLYVWHCHILEHEDHEMMRRYEVVPGPELIVEKGITLNLNDPHTTPPGHVLTVDGILSTPQLNVQGLLRGTGSVQAPVTNRGTVSPGASAGILSVAEYFQVTADPNTEVISGVLKIELAGSDNSDPNNPQFDQLLVAGDATLGGELDVSMIFPFAPSPGQSFEIIDIGGLRTGTFSGLPELGFVGDYGAANLFITYSGGDGDDVALLSALPGDFDVDGDVDGDDFLKWQRGESPFPLSRTDLADWETNYGSSVLLTAVTVAVPEPAAVLLMVVALAGFSGLGYRRCRRPARTAPSVTEFGLRPRESTRVLNSSQRDLMRVLLLAGLAVLVPREAQGTTINLTSSRDNTLYEDPNGSLSNGAGTHMFAGLNDNSAIRRAVLAFDISSIPANSTIQSATLSLYMSRTKSGALPVVLHRLTSDWGEGDSVAGGEEGGGANPDPNDTTWLHTFYPSSTWSTPGGDFDPNVSVSTSVNKMGTYDWESTARMVADIQGWLDSPSTNFGWILLGDEINQKSTKRFDTREIADTSKRPNLEIVFVSGGPTIFSWTGTGGGGSFHDPNNWDTGQAPSSPTDIVNLINNDPNYDQVATTSSNFTIGDLTIAGNDKSMTLSLGQGVTANVGDLQIGGLGGLAVEFAAGSAGQLNTSGAATLGGSLAFSIPGSPPASTESFEIVTYASHTGMFDTLTDYEIDPNRSFSLHYNDSRALAIAGEWAASDEELTGGVDVPQELLVTGAWDWNGTLVKLGAGELVLDLNDDFSAGTSAALAIVEGTVRLRGMDKTLSLDALTFGDLGLLSGDSSLAGQYGWYGAVAVPEPCCLVLIAVGLLAWGCWKPRSGL